MIRWLVTCLVAPLLTAALLFWIFAPLLRGKGTAP